MKRSIAAAAATATAVLAGTSQMAHAATGTIMVPNDFTPALSDTRATGHDDVVGTGLCVWTDGAVGSTNKVAEYVSTSTPLS